MSLLPYPPTNATEAIAVFEQDVKIAHDIIHGDNVSQVSTQGGIVPTFAKVIKTLTDEVQAATSVDISLRSDLAIANSTVLVGGVEAGKLPKTVPPVPSATLSVIDMHYGVLRGRGATSTETFSAGIYAVSSAASAGATTITLAANSSINFSVALVADQLICYLGTDGKYYSAAIQSITGAVLTLRSPISVGVAAGNNLFSFYQNEAHPTEYGYYAIADYAITKCRTAYKQVGTLEIKNAVGGATITLDTSETINSVGSSSVPAYNVSCPTSASDGISGSFTVKESGGYILKFVINSGGTSGTVIVTTGSYTDSTTFNSNEPVLMEIPVSVSNADGIISVFIKTNTNGGSFKVLKNVAVLKAQAVSTNINGGKHVIIGDSWFEQGQFYNRLVGRLPQATIVNKGVGGQNAGQIVGRFETDVFPESPDVVWMITGTNDYYQNLSADLFNYYINRAKALCAANGAHLVIINSSVGASQFSTTRFNLSRRLATETSYYDKDLTTSTGNEVLISIPTTVVPNGATVQLGNLGIYTDSITVTEYYIMGAGLKIGRKSSISGLPTYLNTFVQNTYTTTDNTYTFSGGQFIELTGENTSGTSQTYYGYIKVRQ